MAVSARALTAVFFEARLPPSFQRMNTQNIGGLTCHSDCPNEVIPVRDTSMRNS